MVQNGRGHHGAEKLSVPVLRTPSALPVLLLIIAALREKTDPQEGRFHPSGATPGAMSIA
jgi:hypothetical protein